MTFNSGHPERDLASRITLLEARNPTLTIWNPLNSASGVWEALVDGHEGLITDKNPSAFLGKVIHVLSQQEELRKALEEEA